MSYDLVFWSESTGTQRDPRVIMNDLFDEKTAAGVDTLPLEEILERVNEHFPLTTDGGLTFWDGETEGMFEMHHSSQHIHFCCRGLLHNHCNTLIEIMAEFKCPLYDPQENRRFCIPREGG